MILAALKRLVPLLALATPFLCLPAAAAADAPMHVTVGAPTVSAKSTVYDVRIVSAGSPVFAVVANDVGLAELIVNGSIVQTAGTRARIGIQPFGHAIEALQLSNLEPGDRVEVRETDHGAAPVIVTNPAVIATVSVAGLAGGIFYGMLIAIILYLLVTAFATKEPAVYWFIAWVASVILIELVHDGLPAISHNDSVRALLGANIAAQLCTVGFVTAYLKLRREAVQLFWLLVFTNVGATAVPIIYSIVTRSEPPPEVVFEVVFAPNALAIIVTMGIAFVRGRGGFKPAAFLALGLVGILLFFLGTLLRTLTGWQSPFLDHWSLELGELFDFLVFSFGIAYRARFTEAEKAAAYAALRKANTAADHDPLTGLLNRRGLDEWIAMHNPRRGFLLFIDIDGFKQVNDIGGHAAGDETLTIVARIILRAVREDDAVVRYGGDEFVVVSSGPEDAAVPLDVIHRIAFAIGFLSPLGPKSPTRIGVSIGSALLSQHATFAAALKVADAEAYQVKAQHRLTIHYDRRSNAKVVKGSPR